MPAAQSLARWVLQFDKAGTPLAVLEKTKGHLLDSLGCAFGALGEAAPRASQQQHSSSPSRRRARLRDHGGWPESPSLHCTCQTAVEAALRLRARLVDPAAIHRVEVGMAATPFVSRQIADAERRNPASRGAESVKPLIPLVGAGGERV